MIVSIETESIKKMSQVCTFIIRILRKSQLKTMWHGSVPNRKMKK